MSIKILILYESASGTTKSIASHISTRLGGAQPPLGSITLLPISSTPEAEELHTYDTLILGSAIHGGRWLPEITTFLSNHLCSPPPASPTTLAQEIENVGKNNAKTTLKPRLGVWAFSVGAPNAIPNWMQTEEIKNEENIVGERLRGVYGLGERLKGHRLFEGKIEKKDIPASWFFGRIFGWMGGKFGDFREEGKMDEWVDDIVVALRKESAGK